MKPPPRRRVAPNRFSGIQAKPNNKPVWSTWTLQERRALLAALKQQRDRKEIDTSVIQEKLPTRSLEQITEFVEFLKSSVSRHVSKRLYSRHLEEKKKVVPIQIWTEVAEKLAGQLETSMSSAFSQMLTIASTEPCSLLHSLPPKRTFVTERPILTRVDKKQQELHTENQGGQRFSPPVPSSQNQGLSLCKNNTVISPASLNPVTQNPELPQIISSDSRPNPRMAHITLCPSDRSSSSQNSVDRDVLPTSSTETSVSLPSVVSISHPSCNTQNILNTNSSDVHLPPAINTSSLCMATQQVQPVKYVQTSGMTNENGNSSIIYPKPNLAATPSTSKVVSNQTNPQTSNTFPATSVQQDALNHDSTDQQVSLPQSSNNESCSGMPSQNFNVDFEKLYRYLNFTCKGGNEPRMTALESAVILDLILSLPEELLLLDGKELQLHVRQCYAMLISAPSACRKQSNDASTRKVCKTPLVSSISEGNESATVGHEVPLLGNPTSQTNNKCGINPESTVTCRSKENEKDGSACSSTAEICQEKDRTMAAEKSPENDQSTKSTQSSSEQGVPGTSKKFWSEAGFCPLNPFMFPPQLLKRIETNGE
ncbi:snRNA-activating protein complex subunit 2 [Polypterus senegalus]|nr:snRNA-activating protein complex subunit 2 [Polypterus senegalus]